MTTMVENFLDDLPASLPEERIDTVQESRHVRIERIVSTGQVSPEGFWYQQSRCEWVIVLSGEARLRFEDQPADVHLKPGDHVQIAAGRRHRVQWTSEQEPTVWLAVFYDES